jgi:Xaa-Pro dipeptidase
LAIASLGAAAAVDWEQRVDFPRLRRERFERAQIALRDSDLGALLLFDPNNIRYVTSTHIGEWARDKNARFALLFRQGPPLLCDLVMRSRSGWSRRSSWTNCSVARPASAAAGPAR